MTCVFVLPLVLGTGCGGQTHAVRTVLTGNEQAIVDQMVATHKTGRAEAYRNDLDRVVGALTSKAYPSLDAKAIRQSASRAICDEFGRRSGKSMTRRQSDAWVASIRTSGTVEPLLSEMAGKDEEDRAALINAGLKAICDGSAKGGAWLVSEPEATRLKALMAARQQGQITEAADLVTARRLGRHLLIRIPTFEGDGIAQRVAELARQLPPGGTLLIDLRDNPGGRPEQANGVADLFLDGQILEMFRFPEDSVAFRAHPGAIQAPVIVLANRQTGSAAEMLAMALQDDGVARIVGERTTSMLFGKEMEQLEDGRLLVFRAAPTIESPSGRDYSADGVPPDIAVQDARANGRDAILERALQLAERGGPSSQAEAVR